MDVFLTTSSSPHIRAAATTRSIMLDVVIAMVPMMVMGVYEFGWRAALLIAVSVASAVLSEFAFTKLLKRPTTISDGSAVVTGILLALSVTPLLPWWMIAIGAFFAIVIVKMIFGGIGHNFVNPALAARAMLMASWAGQMTAFMNPRGQGADLAASATPLAAAEPVREWYVNLLWGHVSGSIGEVSILAILIGAAYLVARGIIRLEAPLAYLGTFAFFAWMWGGTELFTGNPLFELMLGGVMMAAFFMVTDYSTSPVNRSGHLIFGAGAGFLTMVIRRFGGYPEGVTYAILLMNLMVPLLDRWLIPRSFGTKRERKVRG